MEKNYCDRCGKLLEHHDGKFITFKKSFDVFLFRWNFFSKQKISYANYELCENCFDTFIKMYDDFNKKSKCLEEFAEFVK